MRLFEMRAKCCVLQKASLAAGHWAVEIFAGFDVRHRMLLHLQHNVHLSLGILPASTHLIFSVEAFLAIATLVGFETFVSKTVAVHVRFLAELKSKK